MAREILQRDPLSGHVFVLCNARRQRIRMLVWYGIGLWLMAKREERDTRLAPCAARGPQRDDEKLAMLLGGLHLEVKRRPGDELRSA